MPADAEADFLKKSSAMDTYGVDPHQVKVGASQHRVELTYLYCT